MIDPTKIDYSKIPEDKWEFESIDETGRATSIFWIDRELGTFVRRTQNYQEDELLQLNKDSYNESIGKRWGDGQVVANIPLNVLYKELAPKMQEGDKDHLKWWLNHDEKRQYRSFKGKI